jgi:hypothetical protein
MFAIRLGVILIALGAAVSAALAQQTGPVWYPLDSSVPPGTPPSIVLQTSSDPHETVLEVNIYGFYYEDIMENQLFRRLSLEKKYTDAQYRAVGRPELPAIHHTLGALVGNTVGPPAVEVLDEVTIPNALIYPVQPSRREDDTQLAFEWDQAFYQQTTQPYPAELGTAIGAVGRFDGLELVAAEAYPFRVVPAAQMLLIARQYRVTIPHPGTGTPTTQVITRRQARQYERLLDNAPVVEAFWQPNVIGFAGDYLIITAPAFLEEIEPLADQKRRRGYSVRVVTTDETGASCNAIKTYIADWWEDGDPTRDHYVLLVGDTDTVPTCTDPYYGRNSDLVYACIDGVGAGGRPDVFPEVRLGRLPCDTEAECTDMVTKTLIYEDGYPGTGSWLGEVLLTAHMEDYPGKYTQCQQNVLLYPHYSVPPVFTHLYGGEGATNAEVRAEIDAGKGVVCYRGHGSTLSWSGWNGDSFDVGDVSLLANGARTPVTFSIACVNNAITSPNCIGEIWMKTTERAVAHYGASYASWTGTNHTLDLELFETIYADNHCILGEALAGAEMAMWVQHQVEEWVRDVGWVVKGEDNAWMYLLLGDPELKVWREAPPPLVISVDLHEVPIGPGFLTVGVRNETETEPVEFAIVSVYKDGEFAENRYTDAQGIAVVPIDPQTAGAIHLTVHTEFDSHGVGLDSVAVIGVEAIESASPAPPGRFNVTALSPVAEGGALELGAQLPWEAERLRLRLYDVAGRCRANTTFGPLAAGEHRLTMSVGRRHRLPSGVYWLEAEARWRDAAAAGESRAQARWLCLR